MHPWHDTYVDETQIANAFPAVIEIPKGSPGSLPRDDYTPPNMDRVVFKAVAAMK